MMISRVVRVALLAAATAFVGGGVVFAELTTRKRPDPNLDKADAIIALTGGGGARLTAAVELAQRTSTGVVFISGVNPNTPDAAVCELANASDTICQDRVEIGRNATSTRENALEVAAWAREHGHNALIIVTSDYHMPRSVVEIQAQLPDVELIPYRVHLEPNRPWWTSPNAVRHLSVEYVKFLVVRIGPPRKAQS